MNRKIKFSKLLRKLSIYFAFTIIIPAYSAYAQNPGTFRMEAEDMQRIKGFKIENYSFASGKKVVAIKNELDGELILPFTGRTNSYKIKVGYYDESDGISEFDFYVNGVLIKSIILNRNTPFNFVFHRNYTVSEITDEFMEITKGDEIKILGRKDGAEDLRIDYVEFEAIDGEHYNPVATIVNPISGSLLKAGSTTFINAQVLDIDDAVDYVEIYANDDLIGIDNEFPYVIEWKNLQEGNYAIYAKSVNENKATSFSEISHISVVGDAVKECIVPYLETEEYLIIEAENGIFNGDEGWGLLTEVDGFTGNSYIQWDNGNQFGTPGIGEITYNVKITNPGVYRLQVRNKINVIDPAKPKAEHNDFWFRVKDAQMYVETRNGISYPQNGFGVPSGAEIMEDSRGQGWTKVFSADLDNWGYDTRTKGFKGFPSSIFINFAAPGFYTLQISGRSIGHGIDRIGLELQDKPGTWGANTSLGETLCSTELLNEYPNLSIISPLFNQSYPAGTTEVEAKINASDSDGSIKKVELYLNNALVSSDTEAPYEYTLSQLKDSLYTLTAKVFDNEEGVTSTNTVFRIGNSSLGNRAPEITFIKPLDGQEFELGSDIFIDSDVDDPDNNLNRVSYFANGKLIANKYNNETSYTWDPTNPGEYVLTARAIDGFELTTEANPITITVISPNIFPTASISSPSFNALFTEGETINIVSNVADEDGTIDKVVFFANGNQIGEVTTAPFNFSWIDAALGEYELTIQAFDDLGDSKISEPVNVIVNIPPTIVIDAPINNRIVEEGQDIVLEVNANDSDGFIQKVEYYNGDEFLETITEAPFSYTISQAEVGTYTFKAIAYDNYNVASTSNSVNITVNAKPQISITSPSNNTVVSFGESVTVTVDATDSDGTVSRVVYFNGDTQLGEVTEAPFSYILDNPASGTYTIRAIVYDNNNSSSLSENVTLIVNQLPEVTLVRPQAGDSFEAGKVITIEAAASDADGEIVRVEFILDGEKLGEDRTAPYIFNIGNLELGTYELVVNAIDNNGAVSSTEPFTIELNTLPSIKITSPVSGTSIEAGNPIEFEVEVSDENGAVIKVEYYSNDLLIGTVETAPFSFTWEDAPTGMQEITAIAYDDNNGKTISEVVMINVALNVPPIVTLTSPTESTVIQEGDNLDIRVSALDGDGTITKVEFYANDDLIGEGSNQPYEFTWESPLAGNYQIKVKAIDDKNGSSFSDEIEVKVNVAPQVSISNPTTEENFISGSTIAFLASARDTDGLVSKVEFMVNGEKVGESLTAPFTIDWNKTDAGIYEIKAIATDENGGIGESELVKIYIKDPNAAAARLVSLTQDTTVAPQAVVPLKAVATSGYEVSKVEFVINGLVEGEDTESPFEMNLQIGDNGTYEVQVKAYYQDNGVFESGITTITVNRALSLERGINADLNMLVYPNPIVNSGQLKFTLDKVQRVQISFTDIAGNKVGKEREMNGKIGENTFNFSLENLPKGMYLLHLKAGSKRYVNKLMNQ